MQKNFNKTPMVEKMHDSTGLKPRKHTTYRDHQSSKHPCSFPPSFSKVASIHRYNPLTFDWKRPDHDQSMCSMYAGRTWTVTQTIGPAVASLHTNHKTTHFRCTKGHPNWILMPMHWRRTANQYPHKIDFCKELIAIETRTAASFDVCAVWKRDGNHMDSAHHTRWDSGLRGVDEMIGGGDITGWYAEDLAV